MITSELWLRNLLDAASAIADREQQECRWLAADAYAWERPEELISVLFDDSVFEGFLEKYASTFSEEQCAAAFALRDSISAYCSETDDFLDPAEVLRDPRWQSIRENAVQFADAFKDGKWSV
jgi:hypothetical protein